MNHQPKVSIITVCFNSAKTIRDTIESVINQTYKNIEYIIVDGGSTDGTIDIIKEYEPYIAKWVSESDDGIYDAMNKGIMMSTGEIIGLVNSDDFLELEAIKNVVKTYLKNINGDVFCGKIRIIDEGNNISWIVSPILPKNNQFNSKIYVPHPAIFVKKDCYNSIGLFDTRYKIAADYELLRREIQHNKNFIVINNVLSNMRMGGISSAQYINALRENRIIDIRYGASKVEATFKFIIIVTKAYVLQLISKSNWLAKRYSKYKTGKTN